MSTTATYSVTGMTCAHCIAAVNEQVAGLAGVSTVEVDLQPGGESRVTVISATTLPVEAVSDAVGEAGYTLVA